jgi:glucose/arabinose dehydrogenase
MDRPYRKVWIVHFAFWICRSLGLTLGIAAVLQAQTPRISLDPVLSGLSVPVYLTNAKDGTNRRFIVQQPGQILVLQPGSPSPTLFLDISNRVLYGGERGLLGLAFHRQFSSNRRFFVNYTRRFDGATVIAEYRVSAGNPNVADTSETVLLTIQQPYENHNGGMIEFGPDGYLYIGMGDGGSGNDPGNRAQNLEELLGKMLRIDVDRPQTPPPDNPFVGAPGRDEIYAYGFRNPWRFSFDRLTGELYVADVGQSSREEIDIVTRGGNYGWRVFEGTQCTNLGPAPCTTSGFIPPIADYANTGEAGRCSIIGGYVYRGSQASLPYGAYVYGDLCSGEILMLRDGIQTVLLDTGLTIASFGEDESGEIYVVNINGSIHRITNPNAINASSRMFSIADRGGFVAATAGGSNTLTVGYSRVQSSGGSPLPSGLAIFGFQQGGVLITEMSVPASPLIQSGRVFAEVSGSVKTGIAIANPNTSPVNVSFYFTDSGGNNFGGGMFTIPENWQIAAFLGEAPFNGGSSLFGTFTFSSTFPVSAIAVRGFTNERSEFLLTTLPVVEPAATPSDVVILPHFAEGGGWSTQVALVNPSETSINGTVNFLNSTGQVVRTVPYSIAPRSAMRIPGASTEGSTQTGSIRVLPGENTVAPSATSIFSFVNGNATVTVAGLPAIRNGTALRLYVEATGGTQSGLAIANPSSSPVSVDLELMRLDGSSTGLSTRLNLPPNGQISGFLTEISGFASLPVPFQGVLRIASAVPVAVTGLRGRLNERHDYLITTTLPADEAAVSTSSEFLFPQFAEGGGYSTQFILFGRDSEGTMYFFNQVGQPVNLQFR